MNAILSKISDDKVFLIASFAASLLVSFLFGYTVFRYWQVEVCKSEIAVTTLSESIYK